MSDPPDFLGDSALQAEAPQSIILGLLESLTETWRPIRPPATHAEEMALGVLLLARGIQVRESAMGPEARLTCTGAHWQALLRGAPPDKATLARGAVLKFIWRAMPGKPEDKPEALPSYPAAELADAPTRPGQPGTDPPPDDPDGSDLVTLNRAAGLVHRTKRTLERYKTKRRLPAPAVEGGAGQPDLYHWKTLRPWLTETFGIKLPETHPANRRR